MKILFVVLLFISNYCIGQARVAAAADLRFAMDSLVAEFESTGAGKINVTYGASGKLTEQISNGGPFHIFFSADIAYPRQLEARGFTCSEIYAYAKGHLVVWSKKLDTKQGMKIFSNPTIKKIAIANPAHAPYGKRAMESLNYYKLTALKSKLVMGDNISQAAQFVASGAADVGFIALSLALSPNMKQANGNYFMVPEIAYEPLIQGAVITSKGKNNKLAAAFFEFTKTDKAQTILKHFGFTKP